MYIILVNGDAFRKLRVFIVDFFADIARGVVGIRWKVATHTLRFWVAGWRRWRSSAFLRVFRWLLIHGFVAFNGRVMLRICRLSMRCLICERRKWNMSWMWLRGLSWLTVVILFIIFMRNMNWLLLVIRARFTRWIHVREFPHIELGVAGIRENSVHLLVEMDFIFARLVTLSKFPWKKFFN